MKQTLLSLLKLAIGIGLLYFLFSKLEDPAALWRQIVQADLRLLLLGALCYTSAVAISALKWGILLQAAGIRVSRPKLLAYQWLAEFFNNFLPAQVGGDVMRGYAVATDTRRKADAAASVLIDRFIGLFIFMLAAALASLALLVFGRPDGVPFSAEQLMTVRLIAAGSSAVTLALIAALLALLSRRLKLTVERLLIHLPLGQKTVPVWQKLAAAFNVYRYQYGALLWTAIGSIAIVLLTSVNIWLIARAIQPDSISMIEVLTINPIIVFVALVIPLTPGGLGVRQGAFAATFLLMGAGGELGIAVGLVQQAIGYLVSLPGGYIWIRGGHKNVSQPHALPTDS
jgi:glycosyltransferase 2 family protein